MERMLEDFVPYDQSALWRIHDAYYTKRGGEAWGDIPSRATNNYALARQYSALALALAKTHDPQEPFIILEVGGGSGVFAQYLLQALKHGLGHEGRALWERVQYVLTDYSAPTLESALAEQDPADASRLIPALLDIRDPNPTHLNGEPLILRPHLVVANYVACVSPTKHLHKLNDQWVELYAQIATDPTGEFAQQDPTSIDALLELYAQSPSDAPLMSSLRIRYQHRYVEPETLFQDPFHARVIRETLTKL
ncbi:MAG: SAM-dependent methyltransferase, partial [Myxococcota bacterium]